MLLNSPLLLALLALDPGKEAPKEEAVAPQTEQAPAAAPNDDSAPADPSTDPNLDVPALDGAVLPTEGQGDLDSLNPPKDSEQQDSDAVTEDAPSAQDETQETTSEPKGQTSEPEFRYQQATETTSDNFVWADASTDATDYRYAKPDASNADAPYTFAPSQDDPNSKAVIDPPKQLQTRFQKPRSSKQRFGLHFKLGPYLPDIDDGDPQGPYAKVFGQVNQSNVVTKAPAQKLIYWLGFEWQFYHLAGPLSIGLDLGFFTESAQARIADPQKAGLGPIVPDGEAFTSSADTNKFTFVPMSLLAGYRFSYLADKTPVPLVPYARAGLNYSFWWAQHAAGTLVRDPQGTAVRGGILGWQAHAGLALRLDGLFPRAGRHMDYRFGINHVSLFGEVAMSKSGLGGKKANLGDNTFYGGLLIEF